MLLVSIKSIERLIELAMTTPSFAAARKIYVFAAGNAETLAVMMNRRLRRLALDVELLRGDGREGRAGV